jgi:hypothetical protein
MDVDAINNPDPRTRNIGFKTPAFPSSRPTGNPRSAPAPTILKRHEPAPSKIERPVTCYRCGRSGHFMRDCKTAINAIGEQHILAMSQAFAAANLGPSEQVEEAEELGEEDFESEADEYDPAGGVYDEKDF